MKKLLVYLKGYEKETVLAPLFKMLEALFELFVPLVMAAVIDVGIGGHDRGYVIRMCLVLIALGVIGLACSITAQYFAAKAATGFSTVLRRELFAHIQSLSYTEMDNLGTSTLITRMTSDINQVQSGVNLVLRLFLRSPFIVFGAMIMAFTVDVKAAMIFVVAIPMLSVVVFGIMIWTMPLYRRVQGGSEDYSCMSERVKEHGGQSCYFLNLSKCHATLHNDRFDFDEKALVNGVKVFTCAAVDLLMESALDPAFLERDRLRKSGIPVKIAKTERLLIRETIPSDIPDLYEIWKQGGMVRGTVPVLNTLDEETEFMEAYIRHAYLFYDFGLWTVIEKQSGQIIGQAGLFVSELLDDAVELGYLIGQSYRGKGYAQECGRAILAYAEEVLDLEELHVLIERTNDKSLHVAQKLGFEPYRQDQIHEGETAEDTEASLVHWHKMLT